MISRFLVPTVAFAAGALAFSGLSALRNIIAQPKRVLGIRMGTNLASRLSSAGLDSVVVVGSDNDLDAVYVVMNGKDWLQWKAGASPVRVPPGLPVEAHRAEGVILVSPTTEGVLKGLLLSGRPTDISRVAQELLNWPNAL